MPKFISLLTTLLLASIPLLAQITNTNSSYTYIIELEDYLTERLAETLPVTTSQALRLKLQFRVDEHDIITQRSILYSTNENAAQLSYTYLQDFAQLHSDKWDQLCDHTIDEESHFSINIDRTSAFENIRVKFTPPRPHPIRPCVLAKPVRQHSPVLKVAEIMPILSHPEVDSNSDYQVQRQTSNQQLLSFIYKHFRYPTLHCCQCIEGTIVISFIVDEQGDMRDMRCIRGIGGGFGEEALRVMNLLSKEYKWLPARQEGKAVSVQMHIPIKIKWD